MALSKHNNFRSNWRYMRLPAGDTTLEAGKGLSPAFMKLLAAIDPRTTISFAELGDAFPTLDADDLELWLAELCRMELISPAEPPGVGLREVHLDLADDGKSAAKPKTRSSPLLQATNHEISVLLVDKSPEERERWREALALLPINLHEAGTLAEADSGFRQHRPQAVVMGMSGVDFKALHLIGLLKHPRNRNRTKVFLVMEDRTVSPNDQRTAQMADATISSDAIPRLVEEVAQQLGLAVPVPQPKPAPVKDMMSVTQRLLYAGTPGRGGGNALVEGTLAAPHLLSALEQRYPRVTLELVERWGKPSLESFLDNLILDSRGGRQGFAPDAMEELLLLHNVHRENRPTSELWRVKAETQSRGAKTDKLGTTGTRKIIR